MDHVPSIGSGKSIRQYDRHFTIHTIVVITRALLPDAVLLVIVSIANSPMRAFSGNDVDVSYRGSKFVTVILRQLSERCYRFISIVSEELETSSSMRAKVQLLRTGR